jgi:hypothetical protein
LSTPGVGSGVEWLVLPSLRFDLCPKLALGRIPGGRSAGKGGSGIGGFVPTGGGVFPDAAVLGRELKDGVYSLLFRDSLLGLAIELCIGNPFCEVAGVLLGAARLGMGEPFWNED